MMRRDLFLAGGGLAMAAASTGLIGCASGAKHAAVPAAAGMASGSFTDEMLYKLGVIGVWERNGAYTVRSDVRNAAWLKSPSSRYPKLIIPCSGEPTCNGGGGNADNLTVIASVVVLPGDATQPATTATLNADYLGNYFDMGGNYYPGGAPVYGNIFQLIASNWACVSSPLATFGTNLAQFAFAVAQNPQAYGGFASSAIGYVSGTVSAAAFADVSLAFLGVFGLAGLALTFGIGAYALWQIAHCG